MTIVETVVSCVLLGTVMFAALPMLAAISSERRRTENRQDALFEVANVMERFTADEWEAINPQRLQQIQPSEHILRQLPGATLTCLVNGGEEAKRITVELLWNDRGGQPVAPVRITSWRYRRGGAE